MWPTVSPRGAEAPLRTYRARPAVAGPDEDSDGVADRLVGILDDGAVAILLPLGHDTGLLEALASLPPATSQQVADAAGLDERYVREWLGGVACAELVRYDPGGRTYALRPEVSSLVTGAGPGNLARTMRFIGLMGQVSPMLVECFRHGGGLMYEDYPGFHEAWPRRVRPSTTPSSSTASCRSPASPAGSRTASTRWTSGAARVTPSTSSDGRSRAAASPASTSAPRRSRRLAPRRRAGAWRTSTSASTTSRPCPSRRTTS